MGHNSYGSSMDNTVKRMLHHQVEFGKDISVEVVCLHEPLEKKGRMKFVTVGE